MNLSIHNVKDINMTKPKQMKDCNGRIFFCNDIIVEARREKPFRITLFSNKKANLKIN